MTKKDLRVKFVGFGVAEEVKKFNWKINPVVGPLFEQYNVIIDSNNPDIAICDIWGTEHIDVEIPKIYFTYETYLDNRDMYDLSITPYLSKNKNQFHQTNVFDCKHMREFISGDFEVFGDMKKTSKNKFCAFMYHNKYARERVWFCQKLQKYKSVDCLGKVLNNIKIDESKGRYGNWKIEQLDIYKDYKFTIAFENKRVNGYVCEKILQPLIVGSIPIYWGAEDVADYINPECFINVNDFASFKDVIEHIKEVDNNPVLYQKYRDACPILKTSKFYSMDNEKLKNWLLPNVEKIIEPNYKPIGKITGLKRIRAIWSNYYWEKKQTILYGFYILLEFFKIK